ncbi:hypothetical protein HO173_006626 [Letharia columbiana]|uniref:Uncharacterized protein n=1 Tax=Letharia columbiana TaxID=112416 RepID=A0A8H6FVF7_9LECA|nr:uncharacterized protein HO173_006626 [Letharia columbiana]KAF6235430.1 hypothetical protein HO173_006626 [Letharia columbiana]
MPSRLYLAYFTSTEPFPAAKTTAAATSTFSGPTAAPSSTVALSPQTKEGVELGVSLGVCACAWLGVLVLLRYPRRKQQSRIGRMSSVADPNDVPEAIEDKSTAGSSNGEGSDGFSELHGAEVNGYQNELEGSMAEGREELP